MWFWCWLFRVRGVFIRDLVSLYGFLILVGFLFFDGWGSAGYLILVVSGLLDFRVYSA